MSSPYIRSITEMVPDTPIQPTTTSTSSWFPTSWKTWVIIILVLALLGINIFVYLAKGTQSLVSILKLFGLETLLATKQTVETSAVGAKTAIDVVADTTTDTIDVVQNTATTNANTNANTNVNANTLQKALNNPNNHPEEVMPNEASSGKSGWCYIGEENNIRTCAEVGVNDTCMSGDIFPTQAVCINPKLRA